MMKNFFRNQKGISLTSLSITIIVIFILTGIVFYNATSNLGMQKLKSMQTDIENLRDRVSSYYAQYGEIPASIKYTNTREINVISDAVDTGDFYAIDLSAMENITLTYGKDYEQIKENTDITIDEVNQLEDLYIINEDSHNIFYVKGITLDGKTYYTDYTEEEKDKEKVEDKLVNIDETNENYTPVYNETAIYKDKNGNIATIPEGFQVSRKSSEDTISEGLVVLAPDGSEFVWVPVDNITTMATKLEGKDSKGLDNYQGKLYDFEGSTSSEMIDYGQGTESYREPDVLSLIDSTKNEIVNLEILQQEYNAMIDSVKKYKGFYIGRYETSLSDATSTSAGTSETIQSKAGVIPTSNAISSTNQWYGLYERQKMYNTEYVQGSMIWGSQYDAMLNWVINSDSADKHKISEDTNGNHSGSLVTTGKYSNDKINNIYDLEGNLFEWTLEAMGEVDRTIRGGSFLVGMPSNRSTAVATYNSPEYFGSRLTLYIK